MDKPINLTENLKKLTEIAEWFEAQPSVDVEEGLKKVKTAAELIKQSKGRLKAIENEFEEIKKEIDSESYQENTMDEETIIITGSTHRVESSETMQKEEEPSDIPF
jgi:hypothetical protein